MIHEKNLKQKSRDTAPLNNGCFLNFIFSNDLQEGLISYLKPSLLFIQKEVSDHVDIHLVTFPCQCQWLYQLTDLALFVSALVFISLKT